MTPLGCVVRRLGVRSVLWSLVAVGIVLALGRDGVVETAGSQPAGSQAGDAVTPLVATVLAPPQPVLAADDRIHLVYELFLTNVSPAMMQLAAVETLDPGRQNAVAATFTGADLTAAFRPIIPAGDLTIGPAQVSRLFLDLALDPDAPLPTALAHRFTLTLTPPSGPATSTTVVSGFTTVNPQAAVVLDPPLEGDRWLVGGGCCFPPSYHRTATLPVNGAFYAAQRFAIDFVQLDATGRLSTGPPDQLSSYAYYGAPIHAVAAGVVVRAQDGLPEAAPGAFPQDLTAETLLGNSVVVDIGGGRFTFYAHMQTGSVRVRVGDTVVRGQVLGLLGNSGNTDGPHLHFHVMDGPSPLGANGLPYVFRSFTSAGTSTQDIDEVLSGTSTTIGPALAGPHQQQLPLDSQVVNFPTSGTLTQRSNGAATRPPRP